MTEGVQEIRALARDFAGAELRPNGERWDAAGDLDPDVRGKLAELGFFGMLVPEAAGGMGFDPATWAAALEELAWGEPAVAVLVAHSVIAADLIARHGPDGLQQEWLPGLAAGERVACIAIGEDSDSDGADGEAAAAVRASRDGEGWRLKGRRRWVTNGAAADLCVLLARDGNDDAALFAVPLADGVEVVRRHATLGLRAVPLVELAFDVRLPEAARLGDIGRAPGDALGQLSIAAIATGISQAALEHALRYGGEREQFGRPIRTFEGIQRKLADMAMRTLAARGLVERAAGDMEDMTLSAMAKVAASECAMFVTTEAVQIFGGYGYMRDYPVEKLMRDAKATEIMHGPNEVQRVRIAESLRA
jgi:alkylation response protein AidB-like acyl-CoA dehydrogenase